MPGRKHGNSKSPRKYESLRRRPMRKRRSVRSSVIGRKARRKSGGRSKRRSR
jgi:hypothetical protein